MSDPLADFIKIGDRLTDNANVDISVTEVHTGGQGVVAVGTDRMREGEKRVVKTFRPDIFARSPRIRELFFHEGRTWISLWPHPNILYAQGMILVKNQPALILRYAKDGNLRDVLSHDRAPGSVSMKGTLAICVEIVAGLMALHNPDLITRERGPLIHRDIKPENILIDEGTVKITDLGLAKVLESDRALIEELYPDKQANLNTRRVGTPVYMAPEQLRGEVNISPAVDMFAFGIIMAELLIGCSPYEGRRGDSLTGQDPTIPLELDHLYQALVSAEPERRPTAPDTLERLQTTLQTMGSVPYTIDLHVHNPTDEAIAWANLAGVYAGEQRYADAEKAYQRSFALNSQDFSPWNSLANVYRDTGRYEQAINTFQRAISLKPDISGPWYNLGITYYLSDRYEEAVYAYKQAISLQEQLSQAWYNLGTVYHDMKRYEDAIDAIRHVVEIEPANIKAWRVLGEIMETLNHFHEAIDIYRKIVELDSRDGDSWHALGNMHKELAQYEQAMIALQTSITLNSQDALTWKDLGSAYYNVQRYEDSIAAYRRAASLDPELADVWNNLGLSYEAQGQYDQAIEAYQRALALRPDLAPIWFNLANTLTRDEQYEEAVGAYQQALQIDPQHRAAWYNLGITLERMEDYDQAITMFKQCLALEPDNADAWNEIGRVYYALDQYDQAIEAYKAALVIKPQDDRLWNDLGLAHVQIEQFEEAIHDFRQSLLNNPLDEDTWYRIGATIVLAKHNELDLRDLDCNVSEHVRYWDGKADTYRLLGSQPEVEQAEAIAQRLREKSD